VADPRFEYVPIGGLLSKGFARTRFAAIDMRVVSPPDYRDTQPGDPLPFERQPRKSQEPGRKAAALVDPSLGLSSALGWAPLEGAGGHTTHISAIDRDGNMVALTQTLGTFFGSGVTAAGVLMNNTASNFASKAQVNRLQPGKQPRSSIAPTLVLKDGQPCMVVGSPGATRIVSTVTTLLVNALDFSLPVDETNRAPRFLCQRSDPFLALESRIRPEVQEAMRKKGHRLQLYGDYDLFFGGAQVILVDRTTGTFSGSADPRRGGTASGY
jgi:gamma-glutamyltranspeptidase/glutathione hydrolase